MKELMKLLSMTAGYYGKEFPDYILKMYAADLADIPLGQLKNAFDVYRRNSKNRTFPIPAQIREIIFPEESENLEAVNSSNKIWNAIGKFGWSNPEEAKSFLGELWELVKFQGGWKNLCQESNQAQPEIFKAQLRESCKAHKYATRKAERVTQLGQHNAIKQLAENIVKRLPYEEEK